MLRVYRLLLRAYPAALRLEHGAEMRAVVDQAWHLASQRGWRSQLRFTGRLFADFARSLPAAWRGFRPPRPTPQKKDSMLTTLLREIRMAVRVLWHSRWSTAATVLTLALAIGATAAVFSVVHAVVLKPLPYADADRLVTIWEHNVVRNKPRNVVAAANFMEWRDRAQSFSGIAAFIDSKISISADGPAEQLNLKYITVNLLDMLGVRPARGRAFREEDTAPNAARKAMLSWRLWQRRYHGDPSVIGRSVLLDGAPVEVVGIMPAGFRLLGKDADVWWQIRTGPATREPQGRGWQVIAKLRPGVSVETSRAEMNGIAEQLEQKWPNFDTGWRVTVASMRDDLTGGVKLPLLLMLAAVGVVLLAGCANTTNLLLARASARKREMAVRSALGASSWHLVRQLFAEGAVLAVTGAAAGLLVARTALATLASYSDRLGVPRLDEAALNAPVLLFSLGVMALCAMTFSLIPAVQVSKGNVQSPLSSGGRWSTAHRRDRHIRQTLVVAQVACAVVLVIGGGLITRSLMRLVAIDPGFDQSAFTFTVSVPRATYATPQRQMQFFETALADLRSTPGIHAAGGVGFLPFNGMGTATSFTRVDQAPPPKGQEPVADIRPIDREYLSVMRVPLRSGRSFSADEVRLGQKVCLISEATARSVFPGEDPLGKWLNINLDGGPDQIIGVVADLHHYDLQSLPRPMIYYPFGRFPLNFMSVVMRGQLDDAAMASAAESVVRRLDKDVPVTDAQRMGDLVGASVASPAAAARLVSGFAVLALVLSLVGVSALLAAVVAGRLSEFGVRLALGATPGNIRRLVLRQGAALIGMGLVIGVGIALAASRALANVLYDVKPLEPAIYAGAIIAITALALFAADIPARRATKVNPADTLR